jgi:hypothetical protein
LIATLFRAFGVVCFIVLLAFAGATLHYSGALNKVAPRVAEPVSLKLFGSERIIAGERSMLRVVAHGDIGRVDWRIEPNEPGALEVSEDSRSAEFRSLTDGQFIITVAAAGEGKTIATDRVIFENIAVEEIADDAELEPIKPAVDFEALKAMLGATLSTPAPPTVTELTQSALAAVSSGNRVEEAHRIAGILRATINRIQTGLVPPDADVVSELNEQIELALGEHATAWHGFVDTVRTIVNDLRLQGAITTAASTVPTLSDVVAVLSAAQ